MNKELIEKDLRTWFDTMIKKYQWLNIKFEWSQDRGVFLVSFSPVEKIELSDEFNEDAMKFADELNFRYGNDAPLFTDEEALFQLSVDAESIGKKLFISETIYTAAISAIVSNWCKGSGYNTTKVNCNCHPTEGSYSYATAA